MESVSVEKTKCKKTKRVRSAVSDKIVLTEENLSKVKRWSEQVNQSRLGVKTYPKDIVNWLISRESGLLNSVVLKELQGKFYDELRYLKLAQKEIKEARLRGEDLTLEDIKNREKEREKKLKKIKVKKEKLPMKNVEKTVETKSEKSTKVLDVKEGESYDESS